MALIDASVRFSADIQQFKDEIKQANQALQSIRSEMVLNEAQFKNSVYAKGSHLTTQLLLNQALATGPLPIPVSLSI